MNQKNKWNELKARLEKLVFKVNSAAIRRKLVEIINLITKLQDLRADRRAGNDN